MAVYGVPRLGGRGGAELLTHLARAERDDDRRRRRLLSLTVAALLVHALLALALPWSSESSLAIAPPGAAALD